jgi:septum formation inhibitor-activating ATPase MinD
MVPAGTVNTSGLRSEIVTVVPSGVNVVQVSNVGEPLVAA